MSEFDPVPDSDAVDDVRQRWRETTDTFGRVYETALGVTEPTTYPEIASTADCSPNAAKKHLDRLAEMGIVRADTDAQPARYERDDGYLEWQEASRIARELTVEEIIDRVRQLEARHEAFVDQFGADDPSAVSLLERDDHEEIHELMERLSDWEAVERDIRLYELARRLAQNDGHLIPA
ncbi:helix-turn-helix transcriptional regulator [Natrinema thermotolerans]|uniref:Helix-turn-helix transcriptional regulator n=1 Tax=Natrinema thermotolerans TaxID=121872 RepID=A0AAF0PJP3_9EURY|nr:helix-turn-helix transcriptional regulator [Natrinema thermotolerans]QCC58688.1 ArsR family transcriptional regulator [Natrinema thermotolerans]WMT09838.1 helix-turn-helix transcriptional regulator [Natrinema thermotolerans]